MEGNSGHRQEGESWRKDSREMERIPKKAFREPISHSGKEEATQKKKKKDQNPTQEKKKEKKKRKKKQKPTHPPQNKKKKKKKTKNTVSQVANGRFLKNESLKRMKG